MQFYVMTIELNLSMTVSIFDDSFPYACTPFNNAFQIGSKTHPMLLQANNIFKFVLCLL